VSRHLKLLGDEEWVASRSEATSRPYRMTLDRLDEAGRSLWRLVREQAAALPAATQDAERLRAVLAQRTTRSREFFTSAAGQWDRLRAEMFGERTDLVGLLALLDGGWTVGDLGCGTGRVSEVVAPFVQRVIAVDSSAAMLAAARGRLGSVANVEVRAGELEHLPLADGELDAALLSLVLNYVAEPDAALAEAARVLRPGGRLVVVDMTPHDREDLREGMGQLWQGFSPEQMKGWMQQAGLTEVRYVALPADPAARGPALFAAAARR
jgi:ubiquinone/menaquinone biosynthesis C-methylase UbiE